MRFLTGILLLGFVLYVGTIAFEYLVFLGGAPAYTVEAAKTTVQTIAEPKEWIYSDEVDPMSGRKAVYARIRSQNSLRMDAPYAGRNHGTLIIREHPKYGFNIIVHIDKGQILCRRYSECKVSVRFDEKKAQLFSGAESGDNDPTVVFLLNPKRFVEAAARARRILVQMTYYHAGDQILEFETEQPLQWPPPQ